MLEKKKEKHITKLAIYHDILPKVINIVWPPL